MVALVLLPSPARADYVVRLDQDVATVNGTAGGSIQVGVVLVATTGLNLSGYSVQLDLVSPAAGIGFTSAAPPAGGSLFGPASAGFLTQPLDGAGNPVAFPSPSVSISDVALDAGGGVASVPFGPGEYSLGVLRIDVAAGSAPGDYGILVNADGTGLFNFDTGTGDVSTLPVGYADAEFTVSGSGPVTPTPAPASAVLFGVGACAYWASRRWREKQSRIAV